MLVYHLVLIYNFNKEAFNRLEGFEEWVRRQAENTTILYIDETRINVNGEKYWVHTYAGELFTYMIPHKNRGLEVVNSIGILKSISFMMDGVHIIDMTSSHVRCNAHHQRKLIL